MEGTAIEARKDQGSHSAGQEGNAGRQLATMENLADQARGYVGQSKAANTLRAYKSDWQDFSGWCEGMGLRALPASVEAVSMYLTDRASSCKVSTLQRRIASISKAHQAAGYPSPTKGAFVQDTLKGIRRNKGIAQTAKAPAVTEHLRRMTAGPVCSGDSLQGLRNRALLLLGFSGAFRRSELVSLNRSDVEATVEGLVVTLRKSKTDQEGQGEKKGIPYGSNPDTCPVRSLMAWWNAASIQEGPLFRAINRHGQIQQGRLSDQSVALVVKAAAAAAGLDAALFSGHSLRAGLATSAAAAGVSERAIMNQTGHKSVAMVRRYVRHGSLFRENAAGGVGL